MKLTDFLPYVMPQAKGCADIVAIFNIRLAIIELCQKSMIWREYQESVLTVENVTSYEYEVETGQQIVTLLSATLAGNDVEVVDPAIGKARDAKGILDTYAYGGFAGFELRPAQTAGQEIITYCTVAPSIAALTVPDTFSKYAEDIATGALARLMKTSGKDYSDQNGAILAKGEWDAAIADAKTDALTGNARVKTRTAKLWF